MLERARIPRRLIPRHFLISKTPLMTSGEDTVTIVEQGGGPAPQAAPDLIKETTTQTFVKDVSRNRSASRC